MLIHRWYLQGAWVRTLYECQLLLTECLAGCSWTIEQHSHPRCCEGPALSQMPCGCAALQADRWPEAATAFEAAGELQQALAVHYSGSKDYAAAEQLLDAWSARALAPAGQLLEWRRAHVKKVVHCCNARGDREGLIRAVQSLQEEALRRRWVGA